MMKLSHNYFTYLQLLDRAPTSCYRYYFRPLPFSSDSTSWLLQDCVCNLLHDWGYRWTA